MIQQKIFEIRGEKVMLDFDLALLYEVETRILNQAVKRNITSFPKDFMFQLSKVELTILMSQIVTSSWGGTRKLPHAFTEHGVTMLASVLRSKKAVKMNISIVRAFIASGRSPGNIRNSLKSSCNLKTQITNSSHNFKNPFLPKRGPKFKPRSVLRKVGIRFHLIHLLHMTVTVRANKKDHLVAVKNAYG